MSLVALVIALVAAGCSRGDNEMGSGWLTCSGYENPSNTFPARSLKNHPGAENDEAPANRALKRRLSGSLAKSNGYNQRGWIVLDSSPELVKFGLPLKPWGIVWQADSKKFDSGWSASVRPCRLTHSTPDRLILTLKEPIGGFGDSDKRSVTVSTSHDLDACRPVRPRFSVVETSSRITLTATYPWDAKNQRIKGSDQEGCAGTGNTRTYSVPLKAPRGRRLVRQGGFVPTRILESEESGSFVYGPPAFPIKLDR